MNIPRPEHPNPQWERKNWQNLNGEWEFEFDFGVSAIERELWKKEKFDKEIIVPVIQKLQEEGLPVFGPYSADGFFGAGHYTKFDGILAMYHDQGLTPFKALAFEEGVNYTAGLPVVRTSPDHGTAYEMAGRDMADPRSMMSAIYTAIDIFNRREEYDDLVENRMTIEMPDTEIKPRGGRIIE